MINKNWDIVLKNEYNSEYFKKLGLFVKGEYRTKIVYPKYENIFINMIHNSGYDPYDREFIIGYKNYKGDPAIDLKRAFIKTTMMPMNNHVENTYGTLKPYPVYWDANSGIFYIKT